MQETQEMQVRSLNWEDPLEEKWQPTPVSFPEKSHGQRSLVGYSRKGPNKTKWLNTPYTLYCGLLAV